VRVDAGCAETLTAWSGATSLSRTFV